MNISKKLAAVALAAGLTITSLGSCSKEKEYVLQGTMLDHAVVATIDGETSIFRVKNTVDFLGVNPHKHYYNIINGEAKTDVEDCDHYDKVKQGCSVENIRDILYYFTDEEMKKAINDELTNEDLVSIISRIKESQQDTAEKSK